jgi:cysteinyl-tRNA synthetase
MAALRLRNTYSRTQETFSPLAGDGSVTLYSCGPTVYSFAHIGNFRSFLLGDLLRRVLESRGYAVTHVMNITDVGHLTEDHLADASGEDKLSKAARELGSDPFAIAAHFEKAFVEDARALRLLEPARRPQATRYVAEMLAMIQVLIERDFAYLDSAGQVYFEIAKFPEYGRLSGKDMDELQEGARVAVREEKKDPRDFALWKVDPGHLMKWDPHSPAGWKEEDWARFRSLRPGGVDARIGVGFPGWHIECSAMARATLGPTIDLHTGGEDNVFPHHECEIAQSYGAHGDVTPGAEGAAGAEAAPRKSFARTWLHCRHLLVNGRKMAKRDGTFYTVRDLLDPVASGRPELVAQLEAAGFATGRVPAVVLRYALLSNHYGQPMNFTFELLAAARVSLERLQGTYDRLREVEDAGADGPAAIAPLLAGARAAFDAALDDDLNMPVALAAIFGLVRDLNALPSLPPADARAARVLLESFDAVLDVLDRSERSGLIERSRLAALAAGAAPVDFIEELLGLRQAARADRDFARADALRDELRRRGVIIEDTPSGVRWKR